MQSVSAMKKTERVAELTKGENICTRVIELPIVLAELIDTVLQRRVELFVALVVSLLLPPRTEVLQRRNYAMEGGNTVGREVLLIFIRILVYH